MILDADSYRVNVKAIELMLKEKTTDKERIAHIGSISVATGVPIIVVCCYVGELFGFSDELKSMIERLKLFYNVTEVLGVI
jgi:translation elongation factor EF-1beta